ncbi:MAG: hypothetical protein QOH88_1318 [Verrucomicrobiota bacterium]|jgi:hypothetical protein
MHKDKPPGLFDFAERGVRYLAGFWFVTGLVLSMLVRTAILIMGDTSSDANSRSPDRLEAEAQERKPAAAATEAPPSSVRY